MSTKPTIQGLKELLHELNSTELIEKLDEISFEWWKKRTEDQWKGEQIAINGNPSGFSDFYDYLNQSR